MYFIDLSMRNSELGYVDSVGLIADGVGTLELAGLFEEAVGIMESDSGDFPDIDTLIELEGILLEAENIAANYGYHAFAHEGTYYVMTEDEFDVWWAHHEVG